MKLTTVGMFSSSNGKAKCIVLAMAVSVCLSTCSLAFKTQASENSDDISGRVIERVVSENAWRSSSVRRSEQVSRRPRQEAFLGSNREYQDLVDTGDVDNYSEVDIDSSTNSDAYISQTGWGEGNAGNRARVNMRNNESGFAAIEQSGRHNTGLINQSGEDNIALLSQIGIAHQGAILQAGEDNIALLRQKGIGSEISITQNGDDNLAVVRDTGSNKLDVSQTQNSQSIVINAGAGMSVTVGQ
ncbi:hypothetical protein J4N45_25390 [Vibrio sp. SCSIO 43140]|uniref:hypothetical protein n=1 Tax=Vibrio sp. SCSIO 43140 TaxID=2819100 RepID=UPI002075B5C5|nr:hypothetical protein [Vibrio sp. SCSIO 43140]USD62695.1 hypothetical protein J4N45_25390 [Vibrio sp. SCSIO 43140]